MDNKKEHSTKGGGMVLPVALEKLKKIENILLHGALLFAHCAGGDAQDQIQSPPMYIHIKFPVVVSPFHSIDAV